MGLINQINNDLHHIGAKGIQRKVLTFLFNVSFRLTMNYRIGYYLSKRRNFMVSIVLLYLKKRQIEKYGCDISYQAIIGKNVSFPHPIGIVIGVGTVIEDDVKIWQHVTFGSKGETTKAYPHIKSNVKIFSSSQIIGDITVGENAIIGAFSLVFKDIPKNSTAVGIPAKIK